MKPSKENPNYVVYIITGDTQYNITPALISVDISEQEKQIAACVTINVIDVYVGDAKLLDMICKRNRVLLFADDGDGEKEVFRGFVWDITPKESLTENTLTVKCYDNLIYWQESDDSDFFPSGKYTDQIVKSVCDKWAISMRYEYEKVLHEKLVLRGKIADFMTADVLDTVQSRTGRKYILRSEKDVVTVKPAGTNETVYKIAKTNNAIELRRYRSMNGVVTQVVILGTASDDEKTPIEATVRGDTDEYGTLQQTITRSEDTTLEGAKKEAKTIVDEKGAPKWEHDIVATDIPWIRKGDRVEISTASINGRYIVKSISRDISNRGKTMSLTVVSE